jgi:type II secretory pathway pseudopilin PulG
MTTTPRSPTRHRDVGDTLVEILLTIVITGLTMTALLSSLANAGNAGNVQRTSVQADVVMRNYAEATKLAALSCTAGAAFVVAYTPPPGYAVTATPAGSSCPDTVAGTVLRLAVVGPLGVRESMQIEVRTP